MQKSRERVSKLAIMNTRKSEAHELAHESEVSVALETSAMEVHASSPMASPELDEKIDVEVASSANLPWMCIVWDDPVNLMSYVTYVFQTVLGYSKSRAQELMMQVHSEGKAAVTSGERDKVEADVKKLHTAGLWATMQQAG